MRPIMQILLAKIVLASRSGAVRLLLAIGVLPPVVVAQSESVVNPANGHQYVVTPNAMSWSDAEAYAILLGGHLATVRSQAEQEWINSVFLAGTNVTLQLWNGLNDAASEGHFEWSSGEPVTYTNWSPGEPNNLINVYCSPQGENYCTMNWYRSENRPGAKIGQWNDTPIVGTHYGFCASVAHPAPHGLVEIIDTDGDGIPDDWEINGVPYTESDGITGRYLLSGANPMHKDLFVEVETMQGLAFDQTAIDMVTAAFTSAPSNCPTPNPDGTPGITLHIISGSTIPFEAQSRVVSTPKGWSFPLNAAQLRQQYFGSTEISVNDPDRQAKLSAKAKVFRCCLAINQVAGRVYGGRAEIGGDDFVICVGGETPDQQASAFMHELGHCLGLRHGGGDDINGKPNYPSIMNYVLVYKEPWSEAFWRLDYSRAALPTLDENALSEQVPVANASDYSNYFMPFYGVVPGVTSCHQTPGSVVVSFVSLNPTDWPDWNITCVQDAALISGDLNFFDYSSLLPGASAHSYGEVMRSQNDWGSIVLRVSDGGGAYAGDLPPDELRLDQRQWIHDNFPLPRCPADLSGDHVINTVDLSILLQQFGKAVLPGMGADLNADGIVNTVDLANLLSKFGTTCP